MKEVRVHPHVETSGGSPVRRRPLVKMGSILRRAAADDADAACKSDPTMRAVVHAEAKRVGLKISASQSATTNETAIVDCNPMPLSASFSRLLTGSMKLKRGRRSNRKHGVPPPGAWMGAAKIDCNVGETVMSVAVSDDDRCAAAPRH